MKLREPVSWLMGTLQRQLFPRLEECWERPLTDKEQQLVSILELVRSLEHVPIIDKNGRGREVIPLAPHEAARYRERTVTERFNSRLKEEFRGGNVMVRGGKQVGLHLLFGVIALFADQLLKLISRAANRQSLA